MPRCSEHRFAGGAGGPVGALGDDLHFEQLGLVLADLVLERRRDEEVGLGARRTLRASMRSACSKPAMPPVRFTCCIEHERVEALVVAQRAGVVADGHQRRAHRVEDHRGVRAHVAVALHDGARARELEVVIAGPLRDAVHDALAGGLHASVRAAARDRLAGDDRQLRVLLLCAPTAFM